MKIVPRLSFALLTLASAACSAQSATESPEQGSSSIRANEPAPDLAGTYAFDLEASDVAAPIRQKCTDDSHGDAQRFEACWGGISAQAKREKIRFSSGSPVIWTSFGLEGDKEVVFVRAPVDLVADGPGHVLAKVAGPAAGMHADQFARARLGALRIEIIDARTIAMSDSKKGRLVYVREL